MNDVQKKEIQAALNAYVGGFESQAKAVKLLKNISEATIINIRKNNWESVSDAMWTSLAKQIGITIKGKWNIVRIVPFVAMQALLDDAKEYSNVYALIATAGIGKTSTSKWYAYNRPNAYFLECAEYFNRKIFLSKLLGTMGQDASGSVSEMMDRIVETMLRQEKPIIILGEADKLPDNVLYFFITLYNMLEGKCAIVLMATNFLKKKIDNGLRLNRKGYAEIYSRLGRKFVTIPPVTAEEVAQICIANGVHEQVKHVEIFNECDGDLRRVERAVHKHKLQAA